MTAIRAAASAGFLLTLLWARAAAPGAPALSSAVDQQIKKRFGNKVLRIARATEAVLGKLTGYEVLNVDVRNPRAAIAGRSVHLHTVLVDREQKAVFLEASPGTVAFLHKRGLCTASTDERRGRECIELVATLSRVRVLASPQAAGEACKACNRVTGLCNSKVLAAKLRPPSTRCASADRCELTFFFLADPNICLVARTTISFAGQKPPAVRTTAVYRTGGYR